MYVTPIMLKLPKFHYKFCVCGKIYYCEDQRLKDEAVYEEVTPKVKNLQQFLKSFTNASLAEKSVTQKCVTDETEESHNIC